VRPRMRQPIPRRHIGRERVGWKEIFIFESIE
jgi:hypothetical protein